MTLEEIFDHYRELVAEHAPKEGFILKTDCFNEAEGDFREMDSVLDPKRTTYIEIDPATIAAAKEKHPDRYFAHGDIREMEFGDGVFDCVIDLSTIDHIPLSDTWKAIAEYHRVLKKGGKLLMVAWCCDERREEPVDWGGPQYFLYEPELLDLIKHTWFDITHCQEFHRGGDLYLVEIVGEKI